MSVTGHTHSIVHALLRKCRSVECHTQWAILYTVITAIQQTSKGLIWVSSLQWKGLKLAKHRSHPTFQLAPEALDNYHRCTAKTLLLLVKTSCWFFPLIRKSAPKVTTIMNGMLVILDKTWQTFLPTTLFDIQNNDVSPDPCKQCGFLMAVI